jgi:hypothetical protein
MLAAGLTVDFRFDFDGCRAGQPSLHAITSARGTRPA